jgi:hypothetical protein
MWYAGIVEVPSRRIALMGAAVVAGEYCVAGGEQRDLFAFEPCHDLAVAAQSFERYGGDPGHGILFLGDRNSEPPDSTIDRYLSCPLAQIICQEFSF